MTENAQVTLALIAIVAGVITSLFKMVNSNTKALASLVEETAKGNREAKQRNGHLAELVKDSKAETLENRDCMKEFFKHKDKK